MNILNMIAESKILEWLKKVNQPGYKPTPPVEKEPKRFYEDYLLDDIKGLIAKAYQEKDNQKRKELLEKANNIQVQLVMSYEHQGYNLMAQNIQNSIQKYKNEVKNSAERK